MKRDTTYTPLPAPVLKRGVGGNIDGQGEKHGQGKSSVISIGGSSGRQAGDEVPKRDGGGNTPSTRGGIEDHNTKKSGHFNSPNGKNAPRGKSGNSPDMDVSPVQNDSKKAERVPATRRW